MKPLHLKPSSFLSRAPLTARNISASGLRNRIFYATLATATAFATLVPATDLRAQNAVADAPISAIDWLSRSVTEPRILDLRDSDVATSASVESISVQPLDMPSPDATGLLPPSVTGLPRDLWGTGKSADIARQILSGPSDPLPALSGLRRQILLAEAQPPADGDGTVLLARIDKLLDVGALEDALALIEQSGTVTPELYRRRFDAALLLGNEDRACNELRANGSIAPSYQVRVFCLARNGDWNAAVLTLNSADVLGELGEGDYDLMARFLDPELFEGEPPLPLPAHPTPLMFRMFEAIGEPIPTHNLPRAFAHADLRNVTGWKARIEAGERLARVGALPENQLLGIYSERLPAASGGVWDRVAQVQKFEIALNNGDLETLGEILPKLWLTLQHAGLERSFARLFSEPLSELPLTGEATTVAWRLSLLSDGYETLMPAYKPQNPQEEFLKALSTGLPGSVAAPDARLVAVRDGFDNTAPGNDITAMLDDRRLGEVLLLAIERFDAGTDGDLNQITDGLRILRTLGLEDTARQAGLQFLLSDQRG